MDWFTIKESFKVLFSKDYRAFKKRQLAIMRKKLISRNFNNAADGMPQLTHKEITKRAQRQYEVERREDQFTRAQVLDEARVIQRYRKLRQEREHQQIQSRS